MDLSLFQLTALHIINDIGSPKGLRIKEELEEYYESEVNHGRLYPNLDDLEEKGYIKISKRDNRTNNYELTETGREVLRDQMAWEASHSPTIFNNIEAES